VLILQIAKLFQGNNHHDDHIRGIGQTNKTFIVLENERDLLEYKWTKGPPKTKTH
jgi:hypothetical protein